VEILITWGGDGVDNDKDLKRVDPQAQAVLGSDDPRVVRRQRVTYGGVSWGIDEEKEDGLDNDGDGLIDEEVLDGVDGDYPNGAKDALRGGRPIADPLGCEPGDWACIDEDIGLFPSDLLHFVSAVESSGDLILQEISYGLDPSGTKLVRRAQILDLSGQAAQDRQKLLDFGQFIDNQTRQALVPPPVPAGIPVARAQVAKAIQNWDTGSKYGWLVSQTRQDNQNPGKLFQVLAYDVRGLRFR
jgi:hypothetical protein